MAATLPILQLRHHLLRKMRRFFDDRGFLEVTTPVLAAETWVDPWIEPYRVTAFGDPHDPEEGPTYFLQTSPELHMKRLLALGATRIYQINPAFRGAEAGPIHNPEFTMVEWYRTGDTMREGMQLLSDLLVEVASWPPAQILSYRDAFLQALDFDPHSVTDDELRDALARFPEVSELTQRDDLLNWAMATQIQPHLGREHPVIVHGFPATQAALARLDPKDERASLRFELYYHGIELANGYDELTFRDQIRHRELVAQSKRRAAGLRPLPSPGTFFEAVAAGLPASSGVALGFDRLVMIRAGRSALHEVLPFPWPET
jgi:lysyl-tRNA synthetase class 2